MEILARLQAVHLITSDAELQEAGELWKAGQAELKVIDEQHADDIDFANKEHKRLIAVRDEIKKPVEAEVRRVKSLMADYKAECVRKAAEDARRLEAEMRKREEERKLAEAIAAAAGPGGEAEADKIMEEEIMLPPVRQAAPPKVEGVVFRTIWKYRIVDPALVPREYLMVDEVKLGGVVRSTKGSLKIPGVEVYSEEV